MSAYQNNISSSSPDNKKGHEITNQRFSSFGISKIFVLISVGALLLVSATVLFFLYWFSPTTSTDGKPISETISLLIQGKPTWNPQEVLEDVEEKSWDSENYPVTAKIQQVIDFEKRILQLELSWPPQVDGIIRNVTIGCKENDFFLANSFFDYPQAENISPRKFFDLALSNSNYVFTGYCVDASCATINKGCRLTKRQ